MSQRDFKDLFNSFTRLRVLVVGDVMIDAYLWGRVDRISPEAPVPIVALHKRENRLGGAANVALNLKAMGATPLLCTVIGQDKQGDAFVELVGQEGLATDGIMVSPDRLTTTKFRIIGNNSQMLRVDEETLEELSPDDEGRLTDVIRHMLNEGNIDVLIFQDYNKGILTSALIREVIRLAAGKGIPVCVDPKKKNFDAFRGVTLFKPNLKEMREGVQRDIDIRNKVTLETAAARLQEDQDISILLLTLSEEGVMVRMQSDGKPALTHFLPAHKRSIADVSGAGDTVISLAALCLASGCNPREIASISNLAGGLVCEEVGVVPINREKLLAEVTKLL